MPYIPIPTNIGHGRDIIYGEVHGRGVIAYSGRIHSFEGYRTQYHSFLAYLSAFLGCQLLISTNSCGSIHPDLNIGDICLMEDHINMSNKPFLNATLLDSKMRDQDRESLLESASNIHKKEMCDFALQCAKDVNVKVMLGPFALFPLP